RPCRRAEPARFQSAAPQRDRQAPRRWARRSAGPFLEDDKGAHRPKKESRAPCVHLKQPPPDETAPQRGRRHRGASGFPAPKRQRALRLFQTPARSESTAALASGRRPRYDVETANRPHRGKDHCDEKRDRCEDAVIFLHLKNELAHHEKGPGPEKKGISPEKQGKQGDRALFQQEVRR